MYTPRLMDRLKLAKSTGTVRASLVHYNTIEEIRRFGSALAAIKPHADRRVPNLGSL
jgi:selenocysteine lyase/cysteine desulfurase